MSRVIVNQIKFLLLLIKQLVDLRGFNDKEVKYQKFGIIQERLHRISSEDYFI